MRDFTNEILELIRRTSSSLPTDVEERLRASIEKEEPGSAARGALETILKNIELSRANSTPICQDTGTPIFYVHYPEGWSTRKLRGADPRRDGGGNQTVLYATECRGCDLR